MTDADTLFALASGLPPCAIAIIRITGPRASQVPQLLGAAPVKPRQASLRRLRHPDDGSLIDEAVLLFFPGPGSATGEDIMEIQCHGSRAVITAIEDVLAGAHGFRLAEGGAFTRRAFANGRMDLTQVEALGDLLAAETDRQRRAALTLLEGGLTATLELVREGLLRSAARIEMALDFADEGDSERSAALTDSICADLATERGRLKRLLDRPESSRLRDGIRVVLGGAPNAGKSTLFNALVGRDAAITSDEAGTTRDVIEAHFDLGGLPFILSDTAGLRSMAGNSVEQVGIDRARERILKADILLWLDDEEPPKLEGGIVLAIAAKADIASHVPSRRLRVSALTGEGMAELRAALIGAGERLVPAIGEVGLSARQRRLVDVACSALNDATEQQDEILLAEHVRQARLAIDQLIGRADTEAMYDALFARFCVGK